MSVPLDLSACSDTISQKSNRIYEQRFIASLSKKIMDKHRLMPNEPLLNPKNLVNIKKLKDFDQFYTAPIHGFENADTYYTQNSSIQFLPKIEKPTLIIQADNDPFLSQSVRAKQSNLGPNTDFVVTRGGGHCGWYSPKKYNQTHFWVNYYICNWLKEVIS
jgi:predicted alpha/beta-fold hydrolase